MWREKLAVRILMLVAQFVAPTEWRQEIDKLSNHILHGSDNWIESATKQEEIPFQ